MLRSSCVYWFFKLILGLFYACFFILCNYIYIYIYTSATTLHTETGKTVALSFFVNMFFLLLFMFCIFNNRSYDCWHDSLFSSVLSLKCCDVNISFFKEIQFFLCITSYFSDFNTEMFVVQKPNTVIHQILWGNLSLSPPTTPTTPSVASNFHKKRSVHGGRRRQMDLFLKRFCMTYASEDKSETTMCIPLDQWHVLPAN